METAWHGKPWSPRTHGQPGLTPRGVLVEEVLLHCVATSSARQPAKYLKSWQGGRKEEKSLGRALFRTVDVCVVFVHLICKLPGYKKTERKGDATAWKCAKCAFDAYI